jgi:outer membrane protein assembly factor BamB
MLDSDLPTEPPSEHNFSSFAVDAEGYVYVAVVRFAPEASLVVFKLDPDGHVLWQQRGDGVASELMLDAAGNCFIAGTVGAGSDPRSLLVKYSPDGQKLWERRFGPVTYPYWGSAKSLAIDPVGNAIVAGFEFTVSKFDPSGNEIWRKEYFGQNAYQVRLDSDGNAVVTGTRQEADMLTVKLSPDGRE